MYLRRVKGKKVAFLKDTGGPIIVEFKDGQIFGGNVDDYETGVFWLYNCRRLNKKKHEWENHGIMTEFEGKEIEDFMPGFNANAVKDIFEVNSEYVDEVSVEDALQFYIDQHHKPLVGIKCEIRFAGDKHEPECDTQLHDALAIIYTQGISGRPDDEKARKLRDAFFLVRRRLLMYGAKIP